MVSVFASSVFDCRLDLRLGQTKNYEIRICCFTAKHAEISSKIKDCDVSESKQCEWDAFWHLDHYTN